jgi:hypothetical protein
MYKSAVFMENQEGAVCLAPDAKDAPMDCNRFFLLWTDGRGEDADMTREARDLKAAALFKNAFRREEDGPEGSCGDHADAWEITLARATRAAQAVGAETPREAGSGDFSGVLAQASSAARKAASTVTVPHTGTYQEYLERVARHVSSREG